MLQRVVETVQVLVLNDILRAQTPASNSSGTYNLLTWLTAIYNANNSNSRDSKPQGVQVYIADFARNARSVRIASAEDTRLLGRFVYALP